MTTTPDSAVLDEVTRELADATMPTPDDVLCEVGPLARAYYVEQMVWELLRNFAAMAAADAGTDNEAPESVAEAIDAIATAAGAMDLALVELGVLPREALPT